MNWFDLTILSVLSVACVPIILGCIAMMRYRRKMHDFLDSPELEKEIHDEIAALEDETNVDKTGE